MKSDSKERYYFHFCYGRKSRCHSTDEVSKAVFDNFEYYLPYDVIDENEHHIWFDDGDE